MCYLWCRCSIDPYIFGNFEGGAGGDAVAAKFRAFKFPDSDFVLFQGTVNVCLNECQGVSHSQLYFYNFLHLPASEKEDKWLLSACARYMLICGIGRSLLAK